VQPASFLIRNLDSDWPIFIRNLDRPRAHSEILRLGIIGVETIETQNYQIFRDHKAIYKYLDKISDTSLSF